MRHPEPLEAVGRDLVRDRDGSVAARRNVLLTCVELFRAGHLIGHRRQTWTRLATAPVISAIASTTGTPFFCSPLR